MTVPKHIVTLLNDAGWALSREANNYAQDDKGHARFLQRLADRCRRAVEAARTTPTPLPVVAMCGRCHKASADEEIDGMKVCSTCAPLRRAERGRS